MGKRHTFGACRILPLTIHRFAVVYSYDSADLRPIILVHGANEKTAIAGLVAGISPEYPQREMVAAVRAVCPLVREHDEAKYPRKQNTPNR